MGFDNKWINLIMSCINSVSYSVLINGEAHGCITPTRGLRQGDPLSPYMFLLCTEGLTALIVEAEKRRHISGISICRGSPKITHLLFADDSVVYCKASEQESRELCTILHKYEEAAGQKVNTEKSSVFFSKNTKEETRERVKNVLGSMQNVQPGKYLGLPSMIGRSKKQIFNEVRERVGKKMTGWKEKLLSIGGREILIKAVAQAVPTYTMGCFLLPKGLCEDIEGMMRNFW
mgnify:FL=1